MRKKRHPNHGGAWKVAYADFVTAMMALFIVLWLASQDQRIKEAVERSFRNPTFEPDAAEFTPYGAWIFSTLAWEISRYTNSFLLELEGHTEQGRPPKRTDYGNWELSTDRASAARRKLLSHDVAPSQIRKV